MHEDILMDLTSATQTFIPKLEQHQSDMQRKLELQRLEAEEKKFEDAEYLKNYFDTMRGQIEQDMKNIQNYFPTNISSTSKKPHENKQHYLEGRDSGSLIRGLSPDFD